MKVRTHTFRGRRYGIFMEHREVGQVDLPGHGGWNLYIDPEQGPYDFLDTAIHEAIHAEDPDVPEQVVDRRARSLSRWLWRLGYRRVDV